MWAWMRTSSSRRSVKKNRDELDSYGYRVLSRPELESALGCTLKIDAKPHDERLAVDSIELPALSLVRELAIQTGYPGPASFPEGNSRLAGGRERSEQVPLVDLEDARGQPRGGTEAVSRRSVDRFASARRACYSSAAPGLRGRAGMMAGVPRSRARRFQGWRRGAPRTACSRAPGHNPSDGCLTAVNRGPDLDRPPTCRGRLEREVLPGVHSALSS